MFWIFFIIQLLSLIINKVYDLSFKLNSLIWKMFAEQKKDFYSVNADIAIEANQ